MEDPASTRRDAVWNIARLIVALAIAASLVYQFGHDMAYVRAASKAYESHVPTFVANFFSIFTNQSNLLAAVFLACASVWGLSQRGRDTAPTAVTALQVLATSTMVLTAAVYNVLLRGDDVSGGVAPFVGWTSELMHVVFPSILVLDLFFGPRLRRPGWLMSLLPIGYALAYVTYTLLRAPLVTAPNTGSASWYPYPFLDPGQQGGWSGVISYTGLMAIGFAVLAVVIVAVLRHRTRAGTPSLAALAAGRDPAQ